VKMPGCRECDLLQTDDGCSMHAGALTTRLSTQDREIWETFRRSEESDRWWQVYVSVLNPAVRPALRAAHYPIPEEKRERQAGIEQAADLADAAIAEARKRGRL
jgi:hypothetical protein